ncbi:MAG: AAA family ATPase [Acidimicrobiales bacterium]
MTESDDAAARGRAIFQRLRADNADPSPVAGATDHGPESAELTPANQEGGPSAPLPVRGPLPGLDDLSSLHDLLGDNAGDPGAPLADAPPAETAPSVPDRAATESGSSVIVDVADPPPAVTEEPVVQSSFARPLPRVMAVANQKGGVGKTTTAVNLGACLADIGYRVLVVDLDPQGNASTGLGINIRDLQGSMYDVILHDLPIEDCVEATSVRNLFCAPSSLDLAGAEIELVPAFSRELRLKRALEDVRDDYDFVVIDCPPSLGLLTVNGLAAATEVVVPIQCEYYALEGLGQLLRNVNLVQRNLNPGLEVSAIILVMYDARTKLADQVVNEVREHFGAKVCRNVVPRTVRLSEAPSFGQPIIAFDASSRGAIAYRELAKEVSGGTPQRTR